MDPFYTITVDLSDRVWSQMLAKGLAVADHVEFNVLYTHPGQALDEIISTYGGRAIEITYERYYSHSGKRIRFPNTPEVRTWVINQGYKGSLNTVLEDLSLIAAEKEILATITHEDMIGLDRALFRQEIELFLEVE